MSKNSGVTRAKYYDCNHEKRGVKFYSIFMQCLNGRWQFAKQIRADRKSDVLALAYPGKQFKAVSDRIFAEVGADVNYNVVEA